MTESLLRLEGITKAFPNVLANDHVDFELRPGEIHALLGENGSGKSTLMKIAYGIYSLTAGQIYVHEQAVKISDPQVAVGLGIGMVHQHFMLVPSLSVLENLMLGFETCKGPLLDRKPVKRRTEELFDLMGFPQLPLEKRTSLLSVGEQQRVEIAKALLRGAKILILDEPTAVLTPQEVEKLGGVLGQLRSEGYGIVLITHKLDEVITYTDRVTVLRGGKRVACERTGSLDKEKLANLMVGHSIDEVRLSEGKVDTQAKREVLGVDGVSCTEGTRRVLDNVSLSVNAGEILGVAGVAGNGQEALAEILVGLRPIERGEVRVEGRTESVWNIRQAIRAGIGYIPEDRQRVGLVLSFTTAENLVLKSIGSPRFCRRLVLQWKEISEYSNDLVRKFDVRPPFGGTPVRHLSGGNQQKVILAREISTAAIALVAAEPTRGLDVGSVEYIHRSLLEQREAGKAIVVLSTDLDEILRLSDRIAVLFEGRILEVLDRAEASREQIGLLMAGVCGARAAV